MDVVFWAPLVLALVNLILLVWLALRRGTSQGVRDELRGAYREAGERLEREKWRRRAGSAGRRRGRGNRPLAAVEKQGCRAGWGLRQRAVQCGEGDREV